MKLDERIEQVCAELVDKAERDLATARSTASFIRWAVSGLPGVKYLIAFGKSVRVDVEPDVFNDVDILTRFRLASAFSGGAVPAYYETEDGPNYKMPGRRMFAKHDGQMSRTFRFPASNVVLYMYINADTLREVCKLEKVTRRSDIQQVEEEYLLADDICEGFVD